jgi:hypothetical protein
VKTTIEINGRKYDARTGNIIIDPSKGARPEEKATAGNPPATFSRPVIDGVRKNRPSSQPYSRTVSALGQITKPRFQAASQVTTKSAPTVYASQRHLEKSTTLLRKAVQKPFAKGQIHGVSSLTDSPNRPAATFSKVKSAMTEPQIVESFKNSLSPMVNKFAPRTLPGAQRPKIVSSLQVAEPPETSSATPPVPPALIPKHKSNKQKQEVFKHTKVPCINFKSRGLERKNGFSRTLKRVRLNPKIAAVCAGFIAVLLIGGFLAYQKVPSVAIRIAAGSAGFNGHLPNSIPSGYGFKGPIEFSKGVISLNYHSASDQKKFTITQKPTTWTSDSLLTNYLIATKARYQTYRDKGLTVFVFNEGNATWVDKGIWYNLTGEGALSSDQILTIAGSM